jgi:DNA-binding NarL/FixJ family response regulator
MINIAIVEDNNTLRQSLEQLISRTSDMHCVASLSNLMNVVSDIVKTKTKRRTYCKNAFSTDPDINVHRV